MENNKVFGRDQSFVAGSPTNTQLMVKDSGRYGATGGWGFAQFKNGKPAAETVHETCFPRHEPGKAVEFVFTRSIALNQLVQSSDPTFNPALQIFATL